MWLPDFNLILIVLPVLVLGLQILLLTFAQQY
jgi:hypothetical protein